MIFGLDFWLSNRFGFGYTLMVRENLMLEMPNCYSGFDWQIKFWKWDWGTGEREVA